MDPIFGFILEGEPARHRARGSSQQNEQDVPSSPGSALLHDFPSSPDVPSSPSHQNDAEDHDLNDEYIVASMQGRSSSPIPSHVRDVAVGLIEEYLQDSIPLKLFLQKMRALLCIDGDRKDVFDWIIRSMVSCGHSTRMSSFLEENGVKKEEIEAASVKAEENGETEDDGLGIGEKRKRRERKRVSISRGLRSPPNKWTKQESEKLIRLVFEFGDKSWKKIAEQLGGGKTGAQCAQHWKRVLSPEIRKGSWDDQEEEMLFSLVQKHGQSWKNIAAEIKTRTDIQCRYQYQKACLSRGCDWLPQEDVLLRKKVSLSFQERRQISWTEVAKFIARAKLTKIPRTALECKERWMLLNSHLSLSSSSPQSISTSSDSPLQHASAYSFNNYTYPISNSSSSNLFYGSSGVPPNGSGPGPAVVVC